MKEDLLIVDDHPLILEGLEKLLVSMDNYNVYKANSAKEGLEVLEERAIKLLVTDYAMPEINGLEFCKSVKSRFPKTKIIVLTQIDELLLVKNFLNIGVEGIILKDNEPNILISGIKSGLKDSQFYCPFTINVGDGQIEIEAAEQGETFLDYDKRFWD